MGADYLAYSLMDAIVDNYFIVLEELERESKCWRRQCWQTSRPDHPADTPVERDMIFLRKSVWPLREVIGAWSGANLTSSPKR